MHIQEIHEEKNREGERADFPQREVGEQRVHGEEGRVGGAGRAEFGGAVREGVHGEGGVGYVYDDAE